MMQLANVKNIELNPNEARKISLRSEWFNWMVKHKFKYLITLTVKESRFQAAKEKATREAIAKWNELLYFVNSTLFRKRYSRGEEYLDGFFVREYQANNEPHVHLLIKNDLPLEDIKSAFESQLKVSLCGLKKFKSMSVKGFDIRPVGESTSDAATLVDYLQKQNDEFGLLGLRGLELQG